MVRATPGSLESRVLQVLWQADRPMPGRAVWEHLRDDETGHARTTVLTVLSRLEAKGLVDRTDDGAFFPVRTEAATAALRMEQLLAHADDRAAALAQFAGMLPHEDLLALTRALKRRG